MADIREQVERYLRQQAELFPSEIFLVDQAHIEPIEMPSLERLQEQVKQCQLCELARTRTHVVFGMGNPQADLMFIGEAPGENEDLQGLPFVGRAGELLDKILAAIKLHRSQVYIANIIKCRPPQNRTPHSDEVAACIPYLYHQIELIQPKLIVCLGLVAAKNLLQVEYTVERFRNSLFQFAGIDVVVTYHPAALLRNPNLKPAAWEDFQKIQKMYLEKRGQ